MTADFIKIVGEILNIHPEPISEETATVELNMGELKCANCGTPYLHGQK